MGGIPVHKYKGFVKELILNAMYASLPVIVPAEIGFEEIINDGEHGIIVEPESSELLARQLIRLYQDRRLCEKLGKSAKTKVESEFTISRQLEDFKKIINV